MITTVEAAAAHGLSVNYISRLCAQGKVKAQKYGRDWLIDAKDMARYANSWKDRKPGPRPRQQDGGQD